MLRNVVFTAHVRRQYAFFFTPLVRCSSTNTTSSSSSSTSSKISENTATSQAVATQVSNERERAEKENDAVVATQVGALANVGLAGTKGIIGYGVNSTALMADAANSLGDLLIDAVVYYTIKEARKKATPAHPWGRGKIEPLGALTIGGLLLATSGGIGYQAMVVMYDMVVLHPDGAGHMGAAAELLLEQAGSASTTIPTTTVSDIPSSSTTAASSSSSTPISATQPSAFGSGNFPWMASLLGVPHVSYLQSAALAVSTVSVLTKELLYHYTLRVGQGAHSDAVKANAWHHRSDAMVSLAVLVALLGSMKGYPLLDPLAGILVSAVIGKQGVTTTWESMRDLSDAPASPEQTQKLRECCLKVKGILSVVNLQARRSGPFLYVECTVGVPGTISASAAHRLAELARYEMMRDDALAEEEHPLAIDSPDYPVPKASPSHRVANAVVHVDPLGSSGLGERVRSQYRDHDSVAKAVSQSVLAFSSDITAVSEVQVYYRDDGRLVLKVDVVMNPELKIKDAHKLAVLARQRIEQDLPGVALVDVDLELEEYLPQETPAGSVGSGSSSNNGGSSSSGSSSSSGGGSGSSSSGSSTSSGGGNVNPTSISPPSSSFSSSTTTTTVGSETASDNVVLSSSSSSPSSSSSSSSTTTTSNSTTNPTTSTTTATTNTTNKIVGKVKKDESEEHKRRRASGWRLE